MDAMSGSAAPMIAQPSLDSVAAIMLADSPLARIRWATAAFDLSSAFGRPMD
jgi:hypothetical protein